MRSAEAYLIALGLLATVVGPHTLDAASLTPPQLLPASLLIVGLLVQAMRRESSWRAVLAGALITAGLTWDVPLADVDRLWFWQWHAPLLGLLWVTVLFNDDFARHWRELAWRSCPLLAAIVVLVYPWAMRDLPAATLTGFAALLLVTSVALWYRHKRTGPLGAAAFTLVANLAGQARVLYLVLQQTLLADGLPWLALGLVIVAVAFGISLVKMGVWQRACTWLASANAALGGVS